MENLKEKKKAKNENITLKIGKNAWQTITPGC